jgi:DNA-binding transcriptional regulator YdaS (Cro superfamily)
MVVMAALFQRGISAPTQDYLARQENLVDNAGMTTAKNAKAVEAVRVLGGPVGAAVLLDLPGHRHQTVQSWLRHRVPAQHCPAIERETRARGQPVLCEELRPDIDWSVLRQAPGCACADKGVK